MQKRFTTLQIAEVINQNSNARLTATSLVKRMLENGMEISARSAVMGLNKMVKLNAVHISKRNGNIKYYIAGAKTLGIIQEHQRLEGRRKSLVKSSNYAVYQEIVNQKSKETRDKNKVFWGDRIMGVGTVFISGVRE